MRKANVVLVSLILLVVASFDLHALLLDSPGIQYGRLTNMSAFEGHPIRNDHRLTGILQFRLPIQLGRRAWYFVHSAMLFPWEATV